MRYLMVDRITDWHPADRMRGVKNVAMSEDFLEYHFPGNPVMPGVLLLEALVQLAGWLEAGTTDFENWFLMDQLRHARFYGFVLPGDRVELEVERLKDPRSGRRAYRGTGRVEGGKRIMAEFEGAPVEMTRIQDPAALRQRFKILARENPLSMLA